MILYLSHSAPRLDGSVEWFIVEPRDDRENDRNGERLANEIESLLLYRRRVIRIDTAPLAERPATELLV